MPATYTSSLRLTKPAVGDTNWGTTVNSGFTDLTDSAIAGYTTVSMPSNADYTLTSVNGAADEARSMMLNITSAVSLTATRNIICPTASKLYFVKNATTGSQSIVFKTSGGSGITIPNGSTAALACNGTNVIAAFDWLSSISFSGTITGTFSGPLNGTVGATTPSTGAFTTLSASSTVSGTGFSTYLASPPAIGGTTPGAITGTTITANTQFSGPHNGTVGATTPSTGAFTTLSASSTVSGTGFSTYLASPPAIGGTTPSTGAFTTLSASSTVSGTGFSTYLASPPAIGGTTPSTGAFTTLSASSTVSGTGFSTYLASPPAIGGTTPSTGAFTTLSYTGTLTGGTGIVNLGSGQFYKDATGNIGVGVTPNTVTTTHFQMPAGSVVASQGDSYTVAANAYYNGGWKNPVSGYCSYYQQTGGVHYWYGTGLIGAPNSSLTFTEFMQVGGTGVRISRSAYTPPVAVAFSATAMIVDCSQSNVFTTTFTANVTTAPALNNPSDGQTINWFITQDATGSRTMTWPTSFKWPGGTAGVLSTGANAVDLLVATYRSATGFWYATLSKGFA